MAAKDGVQSEDRGWNGGFFSHFPFLATAIAKTTGPILECGAGWGSTPLIQYMAGGRKIVTADTDHAWLDRFSVGYASPMHQFWHISDPNGSTEALDLMAAWDRFVTNRPEERWGLVFLDQAPGEARVPVAGILRGRADLIVAHDLEADEPGAGGNYGWRHLKDMFKYHRIVKRLRPWTGIFSNVMDFPIEDCDSRT